MKLTKRDKQCIENEVEELSKEMLEINAIEEREERKLTNIYLKIEGEIKTIDFSILVFLCPGLCIASITAVHSLDTAKDLAERQARCL